MAVQVRAPDAWGRLGDAFREAHAAADRPALVRDEDVRRVRALLRELRDHAALLAAMDDASLRRAMTSEPDRER